MSPVKIFIIYCPKAFFSCKGAALEVLMSVCPFLRFLKVPAGFLETEGSGKFQRRFREVSGKVQEVSREGSGNREDSGKI